jgi:quinoprotein glucose dehydrogenase
MPLTIRAGAAAFGLALAFPLASTAAAQSAPSPNDAGWPVYGHDAGGSRYSPLDLIDRGNVRRLEIAWQFRTGDVGRGEGGIGKTAFQATPILVEDTLYVSSPFNRVFALDSETGKARWTYDPRIDRTRPYSEFTSRGVSAWLDERAAANAPCRLRIFLATVDARLIALDDRTGQPCSGFGAGGTVDLTAGAGAVRPGEYGVSSPPAIVGDRVIVGSFIADNQRADAPSGAVRAFDARTGAVLWRWEPLLSRAAGGSGAVRTEGQVQITGAGNAWSILSADAERDLVFIPTGSASPDFYGGNRQGDDRHANSVVALRASTGALVWAFQMVHHDLWDYDTPAQPVLVNIRREGRDIPAVAQATKMGHLFVLDRATGAPLFPVEERPVPTRTEPGETAWPTQPVPVKPPPLVPQSLTPEDAWGITPLDRYLCRRRIAALRSEGIFTPPSLEGSIIFPGNAGGTNWGSLAFDPKRRLAVLNTSRVAHVVTLIPRERFDEARRAEPETEHGRQEGTPYGIRRELLLSPIMLPCNPPPWGTLAAVDLDDGTVRWEVPLGTTRDVAPVPLAIGWGTPNMGGPIVTGGGLVFIGAAMDDYLRAFDIDTGEELWKGRLPAGGQATPMTYRGSRSGKQYIVIAAGGHGKMATRLGDYLVAFALP